MERAQLLRLNASVTLDALPESLIDRHCPRVLLVWCLSLGTLSGWRVTDVTGVFLQGW